VRAEKIWLLPEATRIGLRDHNEVRRHVKFYNAAWQRKRAMVIPALALPTGPPGSPSAPMFPDKTSLLPCAMAILRAGRQLE